MDSAQLLTDPVAMSDANSEEPAGNPPGQSAASAHEHEAPIAAPHTRTLVTKRPLWMWIAGGVVVVLALFEGIPWVVTASRTVSTDDAYVSGHVTFVAARVPGQVGRVLVDDNNRVHKGDLLVQLDKVPYRVKVDIAQAAVELRRPLLSRHKRRFMGWRDWHAANSSI